MANSAISSAVERLSTLIRNEVGLELGVDKEMRQLSGVLSFINAVVDDASQRPLEDARDWLRKITDVANIVGNILDECQTQALSYRQSSGSLNKVLTCYPFVKLMFRRKIAIRINHIIREANGIVRETEMFPLRRNIEEDLGRSIQTSSYVSREEVFGREEDIEKIRKVLTGDVCDLEELSVYPIIGMGGLGKTTLAGLIFNDCRIADLFELAIWVCVSQDFDIRTVMKQIIMHHISDYIPEASSLDWLANRLRNILRGKRYLLLLDDMLCKDFGEWDKLKNALACGVPGCCVIVTTRDDKTAKMVRTLPAHHLSPLSEDDCWLVFRKQAFESGGDEERPELVEIGKEIVKMCGGVPLAAKALGREVRFGGGKDRWNSVKYMVHEHGARPFAEKYGRCKIEEWVNVKESDMRNFVEGECSTLHDLTCHASSSNNPEIQQTDQVFDDNKVHMDQVSGKSLNPPRSMANSAISSAVERLSTLIQNEVGLELGVDKEMRQLSGVISFINAVVDDAGQRPLEDAFSRNWLQEIIHVANIVGNILDECQTQALRHRQSSGSLSKVLTCYPVVKLMFRCKIAIRINHIIREANAIVRETDMFPLRNIEKDFGRSIQTSSYVSPWKEVFGRAEEIEKIMRVLTGDVCKLEELSVYPIIGMGGLGKTTLAGLIFNDCRIADRFELTIWVCVSQDFDIRTVMKQIIMHHTSDYIPEASSLDWLANRLRNMLWGKRYLLVLDDMLCKDVGEWDKLKNALACGVPGCCVIVTTRDDKTATMVRTLPAHYLSPLSQDDCWLVFRKQAFVDEEQRPELVEIGKEIVKMCGGVPLAAKALGSELRSVTRKERWDSLKYRVHEHGARPFAEKYGRCKIEEWVNVEESDLRNFVEGECSTLPEIQHISDTDQVFDDNKVHMDQVLDDNEVILNLSHLLGVELGYVERSFEDAKNAMDRVFAQMKEARIKFNDLLIMQKQLQLETTQGDGSNVLLVSLQELNTKVSNMKSKIPFSLILPSKSEQRTSNPHFNWIPRNRPHRRRLEAPPPPPPPHPVPTFEHFHKLEWPERLYLRCLAAFPEGAIIKKSLLIGLLESCTSELDRAEEIVDTFVTNGLIKPLYKKCNLTVCGYWVHPLIRCTVRDKLIWSPEDYIYITDNIDEEDVIYDDPIEFPDHTTLSVLHLGIWQKSSSYHVEVTEPDVFFKDVPKSAELRYLSLRGISMIKELPKCITELRCLRKLDLKACHNLEVIPTEIASLKESLTCLDMSECYFLDHMPMALSQLHKLTVLKGFFVGKTNRVVETCTLKDLAGLRGLVKLSIYTNDQGFPNESELAVLHEFKALRKLTISWGGCLSKAKAGSTFEANTHLEGSLIEKKFDFKLEKLDLQCIPTTTMYSWLRPCNFETLEKLYIRGGQLQDICHKRQDKNNKRSSFAEEDQWKVEVLCLKYLKLKMDLHEVEMLFPRLIYLEKVECPNLMYFPTDDNAV